MDYVAELLDWLETQPDEIKEGARDVIDDYFASLLPA